MIKKLCLIIALILMSYKIVALIWSAVAAVSGL